MRYLVIIDNGLTYSDHQHRPVAVCETKEAAERLVAALSSELELTRQARGDDGYVCDSDITDEDMPLARSFGLLASNFYWSWNKTTYSILPIPEWADDAQA